MSIITDTLVLPAHWASYLINGDDSGLSVNDIVRVQLWETANPTLLVVSCGDSYFSWDIGDNSGLGGDVCEYNVHVIK